MGRCINYAVQSYKPDYAVTLTLLHVTLANDNEKESNLIK